jgi:hypothetical protein
MIRKSFKFCFALVWRVMNLKYLKKESLLNLTRAKDTIVY